MSFWLPMGFDSADGTTNLPAQPLGDLGGTSTVGTPTPNQVSVFSNSGSTPTTEEEIDSPEIERAEQATFQHRIKASWANCISFLTVMGRGTFVKDSFGNVWRILSSKINRIRSGGQMGMLSYTAESISFDSPPDDYQMVPVELGLDILKHPRYSWALLPFATDNATYTHCINGAGTPGDVPIYYTDIKQTLIRVIQSFRDASYYPTQGNVESAIRAAINADVNNGFISINYPNPSYNPNKKTKADVPWDGTAAAISANTENAKNFVGIVLVNLADPTDPLAIAIAAAKEVIFKLCRGEDTPYVVGFEITWSQYYFAPVYENPGGYIENPVGIVPDYFISPAQDGSNTIFDQMPLNNPQCYSDDATWFGSTQISWLRKADEVEYQRTWFKVTRKWMGSPVGSWDVDLYSGAEGPFNANDFNLAYNPRA